MTDVLYVFTVSLHAIRRGRGDYDYGAEVTRGRRD